MGYPDTFEGFMVKDQGKWSEFTKQEFQPKKFQERDIDIKITCCGVCGSDVHTISGGWGGAPMPLCVGHEVIGTAVKVGEKVTTVKVGDRVGVGAQIWSCMECKPCKTDNENYCPNKIDTYGAPYPEEMGGVIAQGGYASHIRAHEYFTFKIPDGIPSEEAAPMMCAGLTVYSPMLRAGVGPGKRVAIVGVGGLGHFAIMFAAAMGAEVYVLSTSPDKEDAAKELGAKEFILTKDDNWAKPWAFTFDFMLNSADAAHKFDMAAYLSTLSINGEMHHVGLPDKALPPIQAQMFAPNGCKMGGSHIGSRPEMFKMLQLVSEHKLKPVIEMISISEAGCAQAVIGVAKNKVRYRYTLVDYDKAFPDR
ncbi:MAG: hypothetical protein LQ348_004528 [Seirophora lacunosa]|nr:MAG: hypothetical protein LQ348_004528 [Seirophora lacunosa]